MSIDHFIILSIALGPAILLILGLVVYYLIVDNKCRKTIKQCQKTLEELHKKHEKEIKYI